MSSADIFFFVNTPYQIALVAGIVVLALKNPAPMKESQKLSLVLVML